MPIFVLSSWFMFAPFSNAQVAQKQWEIQSVDTMKHTRDLAREKLNDSSFDRFIDQQIRSIKNVGATHVAIGTPYDEEFIPYLTRWVNSARENNLNVWFRGNFSGWEGWFDYPSITRDEHTSKVIDFIRTNPGLFESGDIFSSCPECENGGPGDPRFNNDLNGHRQFLISEYSAVKEAFSEIGKNVTSNSYSMNADVARLVMDKETTRALDNIVVIDHYIQNPEQYSKDISEIAESSGGKVVIGEFGAPIPDIHGDFSNNQQSRWIENTMKEFSWNTDLIGINYWTYSGGSTRIVNEDGRPLPAYRTIKEFYTSSVVKGKVVTETGNPLPGVSVSAMGRSIVTNEDGEFSLPYIPEGSVVEVSSKKYGQQEVKKTSDDYIKVVLHTNDSDNKNIFSRFLNWLLNLF